MNETTPMNPISLSSGFVFSRPCLKGWWLCLSFGLLAIMASDWTYADDPVTENAARAERAPDNSGPSDRTTPRYQQHSIEGGYLFLDGKYIAPPYEIEVGHGEMWVNGTDITKYFPKSEAPRYQPFGRMGNRPWSGRGPFSGGPRLSRSLENALEGEGVAILNTSQSPILLTQNDADEFLSLLADQESWQAEMESTLTRIPPQPQKDQFVAWLKTYEASAPLRERIEQRLHEKQTANDTYLSEREAVRRLDQWGYPLTLLGMVLVVAAFGHLLSRRPETEAERAPVNPAPEAIRQTNYSLMLVLAMSAMDLIWTILMFQAGAMRELNPFGSRLLEDPVQLTIFKLALTALAVGLIFGLRRYRRAQDVSWWGCLLFTILTVRWLTLNSLFV